jgi:hypothetical protein
MFGNDFIDYCSTNYKGLIELSQQEKKVDPIFLHAYAARFVVFRDLITSKKGEVIPFVEFVKIGIDFQQICLLAFLVGFIEGNRAINTSKDGITYTP